jgi:hypothetical protein
MIQVMLADIHANRFALEAVIADIGQRVMPFSQLTQSKAHLLVNLGDIVGYGPHPNEVLEMMQDYNVSVAGNHEVAVLQNYMFPDLIGWIRSNITGSWKKVFSTEQAKILEWTAKQLTRGNRQLLEEMASRYIFRMGSSLFAHSNPLEPTVMYRIEDFEDAKLLYFDHHDDSHCFLGHEHNTTYFTQKGGDSISFVPFENEGYYRQHGDDKRNCYQTEKGGPFVYEKVLKVPSLVHVQSVGRPRDRLHYAGYAIFDTETANLQVIRVPYDFQKTVSDMERHDFPLRVIGLAREAR